MKVSSLYFVAALGAAVSTSACAQTAGTSTAPAPAAVPATSTTGTATTAGAATTAGTATTAAVVTAPAAATAASASSTAPKLASLIGFYEIQPGTGRGITVTLVSDTLNAMAPNGESVKLIHKSGSMFNVREEDGRIASVSVSFTIDKDGNATQLIMHQDEAQRVFTRKTD